MLCGEATNVKRDGYEGVVSILHCKRWNCEICRPLCRADVIRKAKRGNPTLFITLTCKPDQYASPDDAARDMKRGLVLLRRHIQKRYGVKNLPFIVVFERHKSGWPHMHILARAPWIDQAWLSETWKSITGAFIVDIRKIDNEGRVGAYVSKYIGKDPHAFQGCKRWWRSHNYEEEKEEQFPIIMFGATWEQCSYSLEQWRDYFTERGYQIVEERRRWLHVKK